MSSPTTDRLLLNKERFISCAPRWGKAGTTLAPEFSYGNRRCRVWPITLLSANDKPVIRAAIPPSKVSVDRCSILMGAAKRDVQFGEGDHLTVTTTAGK